jgi:hypothetical protein
MHNPSSIRSIGSGSSNNNSQFLGSNNGIGSRTSQEIGFHDHLLRRDQARHGTGLLARLFLPTTLEKNDEQIIEYKDNNIGLITTHYGVAATSWKERLKMVVTDPVRNFCDAFATADKLVTDYSPVTALAQSLTNFLDSYSRGVFSTYGPGKLVDAVGATAQFFVRAAVISLLAGLSFAATAAAYATILGAVATFAVPVGIGYGLYRYSNEIGAGLIYLPTLPAAAIRFALGLVQAIYEAPIALVNKGILDTIEKRYDDKASEKMGRSITTQINTTKSINSIIDLNAKYLARIEETGEMFFITGKWDSHPCKSIGYQLSDTERKAIVRLCLMQNGVYVDSVINYHIYDKLHLAEADYGDERVAFADAVTFARRHRGQDGKRVSLEQARAFVLQVIQEQDRIPTDLAAQGIEAVRDSRIPQAWVPEEFRTHPKNLLEALVLQKINGGVAFSIVKNDDDGDDGNLDSFVGSNKLFDESLIRDNNFIVNSNHNNSIEENKNNKFTNRSLRNNIPSGETLGWD